MENIRYIPQGQARKISYKTEKINKFINKNILALAIASISFFVLAIYISLISVFINLLIKL